MRFFVAAAAGLGYLGYISHQDFTNHYDTYHERLDDYNSETDVDRAIQKMSAVQESFNATKAA